MKRILPMVLIALALFTGACSQRRVPTYNTIPSWDGTYGVGTEVPFGTFTPSGKDCKWVKNNGRTTPSGHDRVTLTEHDLTVTVINCGTWRKS